MAELGSEGDPPQASSLARFWPGGDAAAAAVDGARRPDEVELMPAGTGGEWRRGGAVDRGGWDGRGNLGAREWKGRVGERGAPEMETVAGWVGSCRARRAQAAGHASSAARRWDPTQAKRPGAGPPVRSESTAKAFPWIGFFSGNIAKPRKVFQH